MKPEKSPLEKLPNIGKKLANELKVIGVHTPGQLRKLGPVACYVRLSIEHSPRRLPHCYYLFSLHAALQGRHWRHLAAETKQELVQKARDQLGRTAFRV